MFFELHDEKRIGYKVLSEADLGIGISSHQTHIGLSEHVLRFLADRDIVSEDSIFIYGNNFEYIDAYFDRIKNPDGSFRSPKIRTGERNCVSIVSTIREIVKSCPSLVWHLIWFGLKNEKIVFFLFNNMSSDYRELEIEGLFRSKRAVALNDTHPMFHKLVKFLENKVNKNGIEILKELEVASQIEELKPNKRLKKYDIDMINQKFKEIGYEGEALIAKYLKDKVLKEQLLSCEWHNEISESGLPYDFTIQDNQANIYYLDVKTTSYGFNQKMIFSTQEIEFISNSGTNYCIYRVYKTDDDKYFLRICYDCKNLSKIIWDQTTKYANELDEIQVEFKSAKLAIPPKISFLKFEAEQYITIS